MTTFLVILFALSGYLLLAVAIWTRRRPVRVVSYVSDKQLSVTEEDLRPK